MPRKDVRHFHVNFEIILALSSGFMESSFMFLSSSTSQILYQTVVKPLLKLFVGKEGMESWKWIFPISTMR
jgi:hypothetical protein